MHFEEVSVLQFESGFGVRQHASLTGRDPEWITVAE